MKDTISGYTKIESIHFTFFYSELVLILVPIEDQISISMLDKKKISRLEGITTYGMKVWFFDLSLQGGFTSQSLATSVSAYILESSSFSNLDPSTFSAITFYGEIVDKYFDPSAKYDHVNSSINFEEGSSVRMLKPFSEVDVHYDLFTDLELILGIDNPSLPSQFAHNLGELHSFLRIRNKQVWDLDQVLDLYRNVNRLFSFFNFRDNVLFEKITLSSLNPDGYLECVGTLHVAVEFPCTNIKVHHTIIHSDLKESIAMLYFRLYELRKHLCFIPANDDDARVLNYNSYMLTCAVFEKVFSISYPSASLKDTNPIHLEVKRRILESIQEIVSASEGDYQNEASNFLNAFRNMGEKTLRERFTYGLIQNKEILEAVFPSAKLTSNMINSISLGFVKQRNAFGHGDFERIPTLSISPYTYAVSLIYIMILRYSFVDESVITSITKKMFWNYQHKDLIPTAPSCN